MEKESFADDGGIAEVQLGRPTVTSTAALPPLVPQTRFWRVFLVLAGLLLLVGLPLVLTLQLLLESHLLLVGRRRL